MPPVIIGAAAAAGLAALEGTVIFGLSTTLSALVIGAGSLVLGGLQYALAPKPSSASSIGSRPQVTSSTSTVRQTDSTHKHIYGMTRFTDLFAQIVSTGVNGKIHAVIIICANESQSIDEVWVDDYPISPDDMDSEGNVTRGRYAGKLRIRKHLGSPNQVADPVMVSDIPGWTNNCRLRGITYMYATLTKSVDIYPNGMPNFSAIGKFRKILDPRSNITRWTPNAGLFCYDYLNQADYGFEAKDRDINITNVAACANISDEIVDTVDLNMTVASVDASTDIITLSGDILLFEICDRCEIITAGTPPAGLSTGVDYYVIPYQIAKTPRIKLATTLDNAIDGIAINFTSSGTGSFVIRKNGEPRYHGAGVVDTADTLEDNFTSMLTAIAGRAVLTGGAWRVLAGAWQEPAIELGIGDMRGSVGTRTKIAMADRFNTISGLFVSQINKYQPVDYPPYRNQDYIDADLNEYPKDLPLNFTSRPTTAKRIAKLETLRARLEKIFTVPFSMKAMEAQAGDNISLTYERRGWESKVFEVTNFGFSVVDAGEGNQQLLTSMTLRETVESIYAWAASEDDPPLNLAPNTNLPDAFNVPVVTGLAFSSRASGTTGGDTVYSLVLSWDMHHDGFVLENGHMEIQYKESSETDWRPSFFVAGDLIFSDVLVSSVNVSYDMRIRAINNLGVHSAWATIEDAIVGSSGGVGSTQNWNLITDSVGSSQNWQAITDVVGATQDWGSVT